MIHQVHAYLCKATYGGSLFLCNHVHYFFQEVTQVQFWWQGPRQSDMAPITQPWQYGVGRLVGAAGGGGEGGPLHTELHELLVRQPPMLQTGAHRSAMLDLH
jgi:hypothetical protein